MFESLRNNYQTSRYKLILLSIVTTSIVIIASWFAFTNPSLLENPTLFFNQPSDQVIIESLPSKKDINYYPLKSLLQDEQWEAADQETQEALAKLLSLVRVSPEVKPLLLNQGKNSASIIQKIPCTDLLTIDRLWRNFSNGKFGFSIQSQIVENDKSLPKPEKIRQNCVQKCIDKTIFGRRCQRNCENLRIKAEFERIPTAMGRGQSSIGTSLRPGYYPSPVDVVVDKKANTYREIAKRVGRCKL